MKSIAMVAVLATGMLAMGAANADSGEELAKSSGCLNCHAIDTKKVGPAYKDVAKSSRQSREDATAAMKAARCMRRSRCRTRTSRKSWSGF
jgi:cytochrome c